MTNKDKKILKYLKKDKAFRDFLFDKICRIEEIDKQLKLNSKHLSNTLRFRSPKPKDPI